MKCTHYLCLVAKRARLRNRRHQPLLLPTNVAAYDEEEVECRLIPDLLPSSNESRRRSAQQPHEQPLHASQD